MEGNFHKNLKACIILKGERLNVLSVRSEIRLECLLSPTLFYNIVVEVLATAVRKKSIQNGKKRKYNYLYMRTT